MIFKCALIQPSIERRVAAIKIREVMRGSDGGGRREVRYVHASQGALVASRRRSLSVGGRGVSSMA